MKVWVPGIRFLSSLAALAGLVGLAGCVIDPAELGDSTIDAGTAYENAPAAPLLPAGRWWGCFGDSGLDQLLTKLDQDNPTLAVALARYDRTRSELGLARADQFPRVVGEGAATTNRDSASGVFVPPDLTYNQFRSALNLEYEIDLWGRVRRTVEAAQAESEAAEADWAAAGLSLRSELARTYFTLRFLDSEIDVLQRSLRVREENRGLVAARVRGGEATDLDLARAETELETARAQLLRLERSRASHFNALAFLCGEVPAAFSLPPGGVRHPPVIPAGLPSQLLSRRPDIAAADARIRVAAARIGAVRASYLPQINLAGVGGLSSLDLEDLLSPTSFFAEIGPQVRIPIYNGGRSGVDEDRAFAAADEAVALYRETVLGAFRDVEEALSGIRFLDREIRAQEEAFAAAARASQLSRKRYDGGLVSYLEVVDAQRTSLNEERAFVQAKSARLLATVQLIEALGGGWEIPLPGTDPEA